MHKRALFFTILLIVFLGCIPILTGEKPSGEEKQPIVTLTLDVIPGADVGSGSREAWLRKRAEEFEAENGGIFINVRTLKTDQAQRIYGEASDRQMGNLAAYSCGAIQNEDAFLLLDEGKNAQPYMYAGYVLLINPALCQRDGDTIHIPTVAASESPYDSGAVAAVQTFAGDNTQVHICERSQMISLFSSQQVSAIAASNYIAYRFCRAANEADGFAVEILPLESGFTDQVHYISVTAYSRAQDEAAKAFVQYLVSEKVQQTCSDIGMFSVLESCRMDQQGAILEKLRSNQTMEVVCPQPFLWQEARPLAMQLTRAALSGDKTALNDLGRLLENLAIDGGIG